MPRPLYIICAESGSEDARTGLVSHFNVIESIQVWKRVDSNSSDQVRLPMLTFRATAVWMKNEGEPDGEYEFQMVLHLPPTNKELVAQEGRFSFLGKPFFRIALIAGGPPFEGPGVFRIESRVRRVGAEKW